MVDGIKVEMTAEEVAAQQAEEVDRQAKAAATLYAEQRAAEYPPLSEQLDYIYHNGVEAWKTDMIQPVKDKYPKPE